MRNSRPLSVTVAAPESKAARTALVASFVRFVFGSPKATDSIWTCAGGAVVRLVPGSTLTLDELRAFAGAKLARYKLPLRLFFVDEMPRNPAGKVLKYQLRERFA